MPIQKGWTGVVAVGLPGTSTFATSTNATHILHCDGYGAVPQGEFFNNRDVATGFEEGTGMFVTNSTSRFSLSGPVTDTGLAILNAMCFGADALTTVDTSCRQHLTQPLGAETDLPFVSMYIKYAPMADSSTAGSVKFETVLLDSLTLSGNAGDVWRWSANFVASSGTTYTADHSGLIKPQTYAFPFYRTQFVYSTTSPSSVTANPGASGLVTAADIGGGTGNGWTNVDWSAALSDVSITFNNNVAVLMAGGATTAAPAYLMRTQRSQSFTVGVHYDMDIASIRNTLDDAFSTTDHYQTGSFRGASILCKSSEVVGSSYVSMFQYLWPACGVTSKDMEATLGPRKARFTYTVFSPVSLASVYPYVWNADNNDLM